MPKRKFRSRKKTYRKKRRMRARTIRYSRNMFTARFRGPGRGIFPAKLLLKLNYVDKYDLNPGTGGAISTQVIRCNDIYDPDYTGTGHQPMGRDEMMAFYNHYSVIGAKVTARFCNNDSARSQFVGIYVSDSSTSETDYRVIMENNMGVCKYLEAFKGGGAKCTLSHKFSTKKFFSRSPLTNKDLIGSYGASPVEKAYFHIFATNLNGIDSDNVECVVKIEYLVVLTSPKNLGLS